MMRQRDARAGGGRRRRADPFPLLEAEALRLAYAPKPDLAQQRTELRDRIEALQITNRFDPGHLVAEKPGLRSARVSGRALVYLRSLNTRRWQDREIVRAAIRDGDAVGGVPDCVVGLCEGDAFLELPCASARLRPLDPEEIAEIGNEGREAGEWTFAT